MGTSADISGWLKKLKEKREAGIRGVMRGVNKLNQQIVGDAQQLAPVGGPPYSPRDEAPGTLQASGIGLPAKLQGDHVVAENGFNTVYAAVQHERLDFRHSHGQAKYLETAIRRIAPKALPFIAAEMKKEVED